MPHKAQPNTPKRPRPDHRPSAAARGYDATWRDFRLVVLAERPLCEGCRREQATEVDHIVSMAQGGAKFDRANLMTLCKSCHSRKTVISDRGFGRAPKRREYRNG